MEDWRLLDVETPRNAAMNIAIDEAIFLARTKEAASPIVRFWRNDRAVVIGYSQSVEAEVNLELCEKEGIQVARRPSGGGAVYFDLGNLNYTIVIGADHWLIRSLDIVESYRVLCSGVIEGLRKFSITANFRPLSDILIGDKKVSGSAQSRKKGVILHHGTLLVDADLDMLVRMLDVPPEKIKGKKVTSFKKPVTKLRDELNYKIDITKLKDALTEGFEKSFSARLIPDRLTSMEEEIAQNLYENKYSKKEWNFWR